MGTLVIKGLMGTLNFKLVLIRNKSIQSYRDFLGRYLTVLCLWKIVIVYVWQGSKYTTVSCGLKQVVFGILHEITESLLKKSSTL